MSQYAPHDYGASIVLSPDDESYVATCPEFPGLTGFGDTQAEALTDLQAVLAAAISVHEQNGYPLPEPGRPADVVLPSGEFRMRVPRSLHFQLAQQAKLEGVSLNHLASNMLQEGVTRRSIGQEGTALVQGTAQREKPQAPVSPLPENDSGTLTRHIPTQAFEGAAEQRWSAGNIAAPADGEILSLSKHRGLN